jgi:hypothetical protein
VLEETTLATGPVKLRPGDRRMRRVRLGLFAAGLATFALLYTPQPVLPLLTASFRVTPAAASLAMSTGTGALAARGGRARPGGTAGTLARRARRDPRGLFLVYLAGTCSSSAAGRLAGDGGLRGGAARDRPGQRDLAGRPPPGLSVPARRVHRFSTGPPGLFTTRSPPPPA